MKVSDIAKMEENAREVQIFVDIMHYFKLYGKYMSDSEVEAFTNVLEFIGRQDVD